MFFVLECYSGFFLLTVGHGMVADESVGSGSSVVRFPIECKFYVRSSLRTVTVGGGFLE